MIEIFSFRKIIRLFFLLNKKSKKKKLNYMKEWSNYFGKNYILNDQLAQSHQSMRQRLSSIKNLSKTAESYL